MKNTQEIHVIIVAAGTSQRFGNSMPKQYLHICGSSILRRTIETFSQIFPKDHIHVVIHKDHMLMYENATHGLNLASPLIGGETRKDSVYKGLLAIERIKKNAKVLIHDAARTLIHPSDVQALTTALYDHNAACLCAPMQDTVLNTETESIAERAHLKTLQTPQGFDLELILEAHRKYPDDNSFTDDVGLVMAAGHTVKLIEAKHPNFKITTQKDFIIAEALLNKSTMMRIGSGFDVHAFDEEPSETIRLGGIDIALNKRLKGHSDADVVLHALTDALLGAIAAGDIGEHFPPSDNAFKDMDSAIFLEKARELIDEQGGVINNVDITIICETPKIGPHKNTMQARIAEILELLPSQVGIKATTSEKLGFTGRGEGIAAQAHVLIEVPTR